MKSIPRNASLCEAGSAQKRFTTRLMSHRRERTTHATDETFTFIHKAEPRGLFNDNSSFHSTFRGVLGTFHDNLSTTTTEKV